MRKITTFLALSLNYLIHLRAANLRYFEMHEIYIITTRIISPKRHMRARPYLLHYIFIYSNRELQYLVRCVRPAQAYLFHLNISLPVQFSRRIPLA